MNGRIGLTIISILITGAFSVNTAGGQEDGPHAPDKGAYNEEYVPVGDYEVPVLINRSTGKVEYYWHDTDKRWVEAREFKGDLQRIYTDRKKIRQDRKLAEMQQELDRLHDESWSDRQWH
ncbi:MAG: hypothetical protein WC592_05570 [Candidatus Omnitrophota bacterium]